MYRMIFDILRFNLFALDILNEEGTDGMSIGQYLDREGYGDGFKEDYLLVSLQVCILLDQSADDTAHDSGNLVNTG